jgi:fatty acid desaturase
MKITKIHGKYYNLTNFNHPGGDIALWHSFDRDATILFESHHPFVSKNRLDAILKKYEIENLPEKYTLLPNEEDVPKFNFDTDFCKEIKQEVKKYFEKKSIQKNIRLSEATKANNGRWLLIIVLLILRIISFCYWIKGYWVFVILKPITAWFSSVNSFHDGCHFALSVNPIINQVFSYSIPQFSNAVAWYFQHNIGHHCYTNILKKDPDLYHSKNLCRKTYDIKHKNLYNYQNITVSFEWFLTFIGMTILSTIKMLQTNTFYNIIPLKLSKKEKYLHILERLVYVFVFIIYPFLVFPIFKAVIFAFIPRIIFSLFFMLNSQITHIHTDCMVNEKDWYKHQVITSSNHGMKKWFNFIFSGGLNYQIEHHLFPNINHCHHPYLQPIVKRICKKYGVKYKEFNGYYDAFLNYYKHITLMGKKVK